MVRVDQASSVCVNARQLTRNEANSQRRSIPQSSTDLATRRESFNVAGRSADPKRRVPLIA